MSVPKYKRKESVVQFIETARLLFRHTLTYCRKFPKSMMFLITKDLVDLSKQVYINVVKANTIYPTNALNVEIRYKYFVEAKGSLEAFNSLLGEVKELYAIKLTDYAWNEWGRLIKRPKNFNNENNK